MLSRLQQMQQESYENLIYCERCVAYQNSFTYRYFLQFLLEFDNTLTKDKDNENESSSYSETADQTENTKGSAKSSESGGQSYLTIEKEDRELSYHRENTITVKLFEGAKYFIGCTADVYMASIEEKPEISPYYKKMTASEGHRFTFLVKNYCNIDEDKRNSEMVIEELHPLGLAGLPDDEQPSTTTQSYEKRPLQVGKEQPECQTQPTKKTKNSKK